MAAIHSPLLSSFMLTNPQDIEDVARTHFPTATLTCTQDAPLHIELRLASGIAPIRITSAVYKSSFISALQQVSIARLTVIGGGSSPPVALDASRFSIDNVPISGWLKYIRAVYPKKLHKSCEDCIKAYLTSSSADPVPEELRTLYLAPIQVEAATQSDGYEETLKLFKAAIVGLPEDDHRITNLRTRYPNTTRRIGSDILAEEFAKSTEDKYKIVHDQLERQVIGQPYASQEVASILALGTNRPNSVFLFVGPTGVGKTELAKAAASLKNNQMIRFDMQQFSEPHSAPTLFGSPASYAGSTDKPLLAKTFEKYPDAISWSDDRQQATITGLVILFDEFEKAHSTLKQTFLTLFDEGYCNVQYTKDTKNVNIKYTLNSCIIVCTSNLCKDAILDGFRRRLPLKDIKDAFKTSNKHLQATPHLSPSYSDELIARMDIIPFGPIPRGEPYQRLLGIKLDKALPSIRTAIGCKAIEVENRLEVITRLEGLLYRDGVDIRQVERYYEKIKGVAVREKGTWGNVGRVKIILRPHETNQTDLRMRVRIQIPLTAEYCEIPNVPDYSIEG